MSDYIKNESYLRQVTDFSGFSIRGSDVDFECDWGGEVFLRADWKFKGWKPSQGQFQTWRNWLNAVGETRHAYLAIVEHEVPPTRSITAEDLTVTAVMFKNPSLWNLGIVRYDEAHRISWNAFAATLAKQYACYRQLNEKACFDGNWFLDPVFASAHDTQLAVEKREMSRKRLQDDLNSSTPHCWQLPSDLRTSEQHKQDYLNLYPSAALDLPDHLVA
jgi:hypothetical protein